MDLISIERRNEPHVIFAARSPDYPSGRYSTAFSNKTVKSWFEEYWGSRRNVQSVFGEISEFGFLKNILFPKTFRKLTPNVVDFPTHLETAITEDFYNASVTVKDNAVELVSATDIHTSIYYWFDSAFAQNNMEKVSYLIHNGWLPTQICDDIDESKPCTFVCSRCPDDCVDTENWDIIKVPGVRLEQIGEVANVLDKSRAKEDTLTASEQLLAKLKNKPKDATWKSVLVDMFSYDFDKESELQCSKHICELRLHIDRYDNGSNSFDQLVVYDDLWAASHPQLSASIQAFMSDRLLFKQSDEE